MLVYKPDCQLSILGPLRDGQSSAHYSPSSHSLSWKSFAITLHWNLAHNIHHPVLHPFIDSYGIHSKENVMFYGCTLHFIYLYILRASVKYGMKSRQ